MWTSTWQCVIISRFSEKVFPDVYARLAVECDKERIMIWTLAIYTGWDVNHIFWQMWGQINAYYGTDKVMTLINQLE